MSVPQPAIERCVKNGAVGRGLADLAWRRCVGLSAKGWGSSEPVEDNTSEDGRAKNRG
jgi:outer membrane protein OmpA-like peptidoglycan-associated protein